MNLAQSIILLYSGFISILFETELKGKVMWCHDTPLTWADFKCAPPIKGSLAAISNVGFEITKRTSNDCVAIEVLSIFDREKSWTLTRSSISLRHEQLHFDIAEVTGRELRRTILGRCYTTVEIEDVEKIMNEIIRGYELKQDSFDIDTNYGNNMTKELVWENRVALELVQSARYSHQCR